MDGMLADARPSVLLTRRDTAATLAPRDDLHTVLLDAEPAAWTWAPAHAPIVTALHPQHPAYVLYTSGSTGTPKGVINTHAAIDNRLLWMQQKLQLQPEQRVLQKTPVGFDVSVWELFWPLRVGARLVLAQPDGHKDPAYLIDLIEQTGIDTVHFVPSMLRVFLETLPDGACASLRRIVCSGEGLPADLASTVRARLPQARLYNLYGPTEAAVDVSVWECTEADIHSVPIGRPIANTQLHVIDAQRQRSPIGVAGELQIAGVQLARGYLGRPDLTAERFVPDPFAEQPGQRMYRTGDVARWRADGALEYLGRNDHQVKLRGVRIELGEIEAALRGCGGVREAVVIARVDTPSEIQLVAYLVGDTLAVTPALLRTQLRTRLPDYMLPAAYVQLDALPLTPNGKLDSRALPAPDDQSLDLHVYVPPQGELEHVMAALWSELLGVEQVGRHDDFFALGGHSLLAVKLIERLRRLGWQLDVRSLFSTPTLASLAAGLAAASEVIVPPNRIGPACTRITPDLLPLVELTQAEIDTVVATVAGGVRNVQDIYPLASLQEGLLFHHLANPLADPYLHSVLLSFPSRDQLDAFLDALDQVVARHDMLRTGFAWQGLPAPVQVVWRQATLARRLHVFDGPGPAAELQDWMHAPAAALSVQHAPLIHAHLAHDPVAGRWLLGLQHHHLVMDHTTLELVIEEVQAHLSGRQQHLPAPLPFRDFIAHARNGMSEQDHQAFFTEMLGDIDAPTAPFGALAPVHGLAALERIQRPLPAALAHTVRAQARRHGVSVASIFHLAYTLLLARSSGRDEVVFGTVLFGRMHASAGADRMLGMLLNTLPIRLGGAHHSVLHAVRHTQLCLARLLHHEHAPLALAQRCSRLDPALPLLNALLNYRYAGGSNVLSTTQDDPLQDVQQIAGQERTHYPLLVSIDDHSEAGGFSFDVQCVQEIGAERIAAMLQQTLHVLVQALEQAPQTALRALDLLTEEERASVCALSRSKATYADKRCLHSLFEQQVAQAPHAIAVVHDDLALGYAELDARANQLAHHLIAHGIGPEERVALYLERGIDLVVAILAVLKSGAAYVPLDPAYPAQRLAFMLDDAQPRLLLTHRALAANLPNESGIATVLLDDAPVWAQQPTHAPQRSDVLAQHPAYVIYTSGSTGTPKGVIVAHAQVVRLLHATGACVAPTAEDVWTLFHSCAFDFSVWELWGALAHGGRLVVVPQHTARDPVAFHALLCQQRVSVLNQTPSAFQALIDAERHSDLQHNLRLVIFGGEALQPATLAPWFAQHGQRTAMINMYGITETTVHVTAHAITEHDVARADLSPVGLPLADLCAYVLAGDGQCLPIGVAGELHVAGAGLARGYLGRPGLTAERFVPDPFAEQPGERMYRTGDLARWQADGRLEYLGRNDDQVKLRGFRIELGEIQAAVRACDGVRQAAVVVREDNPGDKRLVAYLVGDTDITLNADALRTQLGARLPDYMLPAAYVQLDTLPLTANGKLDRRALPAPDADALAVQAYIAPEGELETLLAALWCELLGVERVGRQDNFFALGGHSLLTVRLSAAIRRDLQCDLPIQSLFAQPTLQQMAYLVLSTRLQQLQAADAADVLSKAKLER
ncbi:non-ribosomal peptide synthetase [Xanthomonas translucens]|uniref:non-ribosomal peptide synthetase n=1 Tax=Xanthomonas campestris pv. translucens TaxID=343 RepID=UPI0022AB377B|nr:non-ribosomal peptide synthetase [Xanthomonas translucens]